MPRPPRIEFTNAWYHVTNRGASNRVIFKNQEHIQLFSDLLTACCKQFDIQIHAACLLPNAYHLLVCTPKGGLSQAMRHLNGLYTQRFNKITDSDGPLFKSRYRATLLQQNYILPISRYIHLKPVLENLTKLPEQYKWSSYRSYLGKQHKPKWLHTQYIRNHCQDYQTFIKAGVDAECLQYFRQKKRSAVLGNFEFKQMLQKQNFAVPVKENSHGPNIDSIIDETAHFFNVNRDSLQFSRRGQSNLARSVAIYLSRTLGKHRLTEIARMFSGISHAAVGTAVKRFEQTLAQNQTLKESILQLQQKIETQNAQHLHHKEGINHEKHTEIINCAS